MPRKCDPYCIVEIPFLFGPRFLSLPATARCVYLALWGRAVEMRREQLPCWYDTAAIQGDCRLDTRTVRKSVALLQQKCLIIIHPENGITICGVKTKHPDLTWKDNVSNGKVGEEKGSPMTPSIDKPNIDKPNPTQPIEPDAGANTPKSEYSEKYEEAWKALDPHKTSDAKGKGWHAWKARLKEDKTLEEEMLTGAKNYAAWRLRDKVGWVWNTATFFGPEKHWQKFKDGVPPPEAKPGVYTEGAESDTLRQMKAKLSKETV